MLLAFVLLIFVPASKVFILNLFDSMSHYCQIIHYSPVFIQLQIDRFFRLNPTMLAKNAMNPVVYQQLHQKSVNPSIRRDLKVFQSTQDLFRSPNVLQPNRWDTNVMYPRYTFDLTSTVHLNNRLINGGIISIDIQDPQYASCKST